VKTDQTDAELLARLLQVGFIRPVWVPSRAQRAVRNLVEYRMTVSRQRTATVNRIRALLRQEMVDPPRLGLTCPATRQFLDGFAGAAPEHSVMMTSLRATLDLLEQELERVDSALGEFCRHSSEARLLTTIPGFGPVVAAMVMSQIGEVSRFSSPRPLAAYAGLAPRVVSSGKTSYTGAISRRSRSILRWALSQAVTNAVRRPGQLQRWYEELCQRRPRAVARVACCRKLLGVVWHMLRHEAPYRDQDTALTARKWRKWGWDVPPAVVS